MVRVTFTDSSDDSKTVNGRVVVEALDGGLLIEDSQGRLWNIVPEKIHQREGLAGPFRYFDSDELTSQLRAEFGDRFDIVQTNHFVICSAAGQAYAQWCGALLEKVRRKFFDYWGRVIADQHVPDRPLIVIIFKNRKEFAHYAGQNTAAELSDSFGYYSARSNRIYLFDLTARQGSAPAKTTRDVFRLMSSTPFSVATIVHEVTHQVAFNSGLQTRYADNPLWMSEGLAMFFETPDLRKSRGWQSAGRINRLRLDQLRRGWKRLPADSLRQLVANDDRIRNPDQVELAYAESWALSHFLIRKYRDKYVAYLKIISQKKPLMWDTPEQRLKDFQSAFGVAPGELREAFERYITRLK